MSLEKRVLLNKRRRELYAQKRHQKVCKDATNDSKGDFPVNRYSNNIDFFIVKNFVVLQDIYYINKILDSLIALIIGGNEESLPPGDIDDSLTETDINTIHETGTPLQNCGFVFSY